MNKQSQESCPVISPVRRSVPVPPELVDRKGQCIFGTFDGEFQSMNLRKAKKPTSLPSCFNSLKLTQWEAVEIFFDEGILLAALCDMGITGKLLLVYYDKETQSCTSWNTTLTSGVIHIAPNLLSGNRTWTAIKQGSISFENHLDQGRLQLSGTHENRRGDTVSYGLSLTRVSLPSVVSIPFGKNRPLYSQKDLFTVNGSLTVKGNTYVFREDAVAVMDDHRGFYPRRSHYDWVTTMGFQDPGVYSHPFGINLTRNQSLNQEDYNENLIWLPNKTSLLPPVSFDKSAPLSPSCHPEDISWTIKDSQGMTNLTFQLTAFYPVILHALVVRIDYYILFGTITGTLMQEDGTLLTLDQVPAMGEDKTLLF